MPQINEACYVLPIISLENIALYKFQLVIDKNTFVYKKHKLSLVFQTIECPEMTWF